MNTAINFSDITKHLLGVLDTRSQDVITRRYGLEKDAETLEAIGQEYGITRERVRQIEVAAKKALAKLESTYIPIRQLLEETFSAAGGILTEEYLSKFLAKKVSPAPTPSITRFYLDILPEYTFEAHQANLRPAWQHARLAQPQITQIVTAANTSLAKAGKPQSEEQLINEIKKALTGEMMPTEYFGAALAAAADIGRTAFGDWGLTAWAEVSPRGVSDKAYTVLRRHGQPEHFRAITVLINEARFDSKQANPQTVHNELIKDDRFVLVGRGLYGLKEWGYVPGTVADVLESILRRSQAPLSREELIDQVLKQRLVKKNTILLGLQNSKRFAKSAKNTYTLAA